MEFGLSPGTDVQVRSRLGAVGGAPVRSQGLSTVKHAPFLASRFPTGRRLPKIAQLQIPPAGSLPTVVITAQGGGGRRFSVLSTMLFVMPLCPLFDERLLQAPIWLVRALIKIHDQQNT